MIDGCLIIGFILFLALFSWYREISVVSTVCVGLQESTQLLRRTVPTLAGYITAFTVFKAAGGLDWLLSWFPVESGQSELLDLLPMAIARPFSGSVTTGLFANLLQTQPDPMVATQAAVMIGSTETTFYVVSVYFAAVGIRKTRFAVPLGLVLDGLGFLISLLVVRWLFQLSWFPILSYS